MAEDYKASIATVKAAHDIVDYLRGAGVNLLPHGVGKWKANCPFHKEKTPSFIVNESFQNYKCWGCGVFGDVLTFAVEYENLSFTDALRKLASDKNIELDLSGASDGVDYDSLHKILKVAANFYCKKFDALPEDHVAKKEILKRGLTFNNRKKEGLKYGYSPTGNQLYKELSAQGFSDDLILQSGLCRKSESNGNIFDFFRSRLMFIFTDRYNKPVGFSSRKLFEDDDRGKYVNSSESPLFHKSQVLYNHFLARKPSGVAKEIFIAEGQFDVGAFVEAGLLNCVASSGTALTRDHMTECKKMVGTSGRLIFCLDGDEAGLKAAAKIFLSFPDLHEDAYVVIFPDEEDPCDYRLRAGSEKLVEFVQNPLTLVEFMIKQAKGKYDLSSVVGQSKYVSEGASIVKTVSNLTLRENCVKLLSLEALTPIDVVREAVAKAKPLVEEGPQDLGEALPLPEERELTLSEEVERVKRLVEEDYFYNLAARFTALGMARPKWRSSVVRSKNLLPKSFAPFLEEVEALGEKEVIFPELFEHSELAEVFLTSDFSDFYKFMEMEELKEHFIYLHEKLGKTVEQARRRKRDRQIMELLQKDESGSLKYFQGLVEKFGSGGSTSVTPGLSDG